jgi:hypothetical protein
MTLLIVCLMFRELEMRKWQLEQAESEIQEKERRSAERLSQIDKDCQSKQEKLQKICTYVYLFL